MSITEAGLVLGLLAYALWGVLPLYFKAIEVLAATDIVAHRVIWSLPFLALLIALTRAWPKVGRRREHRRTVGILLVTAVLIGGNWLLYVYAVTSGHILAASFGYYLNPLANVLLGRFVLHERLNRLQWTAVAHCRRGNFGARRRRARSALDQPDPMHDLRALRPASENGRAPTRSPASASKPRSFFLLALLWLGWRHSTGAPVMGNSEMLTDPAALAGIVSTTPLLLFTAAAKRLPYSTLGMLQFIAPTLQFLIASALWRAAHGPRTSLPSPRSGSRSASTSSRLLRSPRLPQAARMMIGADPCSTSSR